MDADDLPASTGESQYDDILQQYFFDTNNNGSIGSIDLDLLWDTQVDQSFSLGDQVAFSALATTPESLDITLGSFFSFNNTIEIDSQNAAWSFGDVVSPLSSQYGYNLSNQLDESLLTIPSTPALWRVQQFSNASHIEPEARSSSILPEQTQTPLLAPGVPTRNDTSSLDALSDNSPTSTCESEVSLKHMHSHHTTNQTGDSRAIGFNPQRKPRRKRSTNVPQSNKSLITIVAVDPSRSGSRSKVQKPRRAFDNGQRREVAAVRKKGACFRCRMWKTKVNSPTLIDSLCTK